MICYHCINRVFPCQKGFLLLEALVALTALAILMTVVASWYAHAVIAQKRVTERLAASNSAVSYMGQLQARHAVPFAGVTGHDGFTVETTVTPDPDQPHLYWVQLRVSKKSATTPGTEPIVAELISAVVA